MTLFYVHFTYIWDSLSHGSAKFGGELDSIKSDLQDVVNEGKERTQGEGSHKQGQEPKL